MARHLDDRVIEAARCISQASLLIRDAAAELEEEPSMQQLCLRLADWVAALTEVLVPLE